MFLWVIIFNGKEKVIRQRMQCKESSVLLKSKTNDFYLTVSVPLDSLVVVVKSTSMNAPLNRVTTVELAQIYLRATDANVQPDIPESIARRRSTIAVTIPVQPELCVRMSLASKITLACAAVDTREPIVI